MLQRLFKRSSFGQLMLMIGLLVGVPLLTIPFNPQDLQYALSFLIPCAFSCLLGILVCIFGIFDNSNETKRIVSIQKSNLTVLFAWTWGIFIGSLPFLLADKLTFVQALFESVSGWTTTGLSVMDVSLTPPIFLFFRSFTQFCGGLGFVMMMVTLVYDKQSMNLFNAEGHPDKLMPNLKRTAQAIFLIYTSFLVIGIITYILAGMNLFDSICHTMCALSTGGFSTKLNSIGEYDSLAIEIITIALMIIGTTNFAVLLLLVKRKWRQLFKVSEVRFMFLLLLILIPITALSLASELNMSIGESIRIATFDIASALSTTGYSTMSYTSWPPFAVGILIIIMLIGGGIGSTAGGMKMTRIYIILRMANSNIKKRLLPIRNVEAPHYIKAQGKVPLDYDTTSDTIGFVVCYMILFVIGSLLITLSEGCNFTEGMFEFASALGTVGLSIGITGPTTSASTLIIEMFGMIMGRLEIFIVLLGLYSIMNIRYYPRLSK